jgi:hypothetical protein
MNLDAVIIRVQSEFNEMPGLRLTERQALRLWGVDHATCRHVIDILVDRRFLRRTPNGHIGRADS